MKPMALCLFVICGHLFSFATSDPQFPVSEIPEPLTKNVNAVIRKNDRTFKIEARDRATYSVHVVVTILNEQGKSFATEIVGYDKLTKVKDINGNVYDATGKLIKRLRNNEIYDQSAYDGVTLFSDNRLKAIDLRHGNYPYTVEFRYELELKYLFHIPRFVVVTDDKVSVQSASYALQYPPHLKPRYKQLGTGKAPELIKAENSEKLLWEFNNVMPIRQEAHGPGPEATTPQILAAPSEFEYADYSGSMNTWDEFGKWIGALNKGRDVVPEKTQQEILSLTAEARTIEEKTKIVYQYLQNKTRYVGIQLGIGGYQPFDATVVDQTGYGDCKALSNYMVSMLKSIGIRSHYALINAGTYASELKPDFVSSQFNHAVVAVPNGADTLWLECTSQTKPFAYAGLFTGDRKALLITDTGAEIAHTTRYTAEQNIQLCTADVTLDKAGNGTAKVKTVYGGLQYENSSLDAILNNAYDEQKKWIQQNTKIPSFEIKGFALTNHKDKIPYATVDLDLELSRFANVSGKRIFLTPNLLNRNNYVPDAVSDRRSDVVRRIAFTDVDTIRYQLPDEIYPEFLPEPIEIENRFGRYEAKFITEQGRLLYVRRLKMNKGVFPPSSYQELIDFYRSISKADNTRMVFMTKT